MLGQKMYIFHDIPAGSPHQPMENVQCYGQIWNPKQKLKGVGCVCVCVCVCGSGTGRCG